MVDMTYTGDYYGSGGGVDIDPIQLKMLNIGIDRADLGNGATTHSALPSLDDFFGLGYNDISVESVPTTAGSITPTAPPSHEYEDTDYTDVTHQTTAAPTSTNMPSNGSTCNCVTTPCNCTAKQDAPDMMSLEYWKGWVANQSQNRKLIGLGLVTLIIILAFRAGKHG